MAGMRVWVGIFFMVGVLVGCGASDTVRVEGVFKIEGEYHSPDVRFYIEDRGKKIYIQPWLPLGALHRPFPDEKGKVRPPIMRDYLNQKVKIEGKKSGDYLKIESAVIMEK